MLELPVTSNISPPSRPSLGKLYPAQRIVGRRTMIAFSFGVAGFQAGRPVIHPARAVRAVRGESACMMAGKVVVTDGTCSFYESRGIFQELHDHGDFSGIEAYSAGSGTTADAKKMLLSRNKKSFVLHKKTCSSCTSMK